MSERENQDKPFDAAYGRLVRVLMGIRMILTPVERMQIGYALRQVKRAYEEGK